MMKFVAMLVVPLIPVVVLFTLFPNAAVNVVTKIPGLVAGQEEQITAGGAVALYFILVTIAVKVFKVDKIDELTPLRHKLSGDWDLAANDKPVGLANIRVSNRTRRLSILGHWNDSQTEVPWHAGQITLEPDLLSYITTTTRKKAGKTETVRSLVELHIPAEEKLRNLSGQYYLVEEEGVGSLSLKKRNVSRYFFGLFRKSQSSGLSDGHHSPQDVGEIPAGR
jgi:hypothetical protein